MSIFEMTVEPTPQWIKDAAKEIAKEHKITDFLDIICIGGIISKHYNRNSQKS